MTTNEANRYEGKTAAEWREEGYGYNRRRNESFDRCDTDGFLSQWADGIHANLCERKAELAANGALSTFTGLYRKADGKRIRAKKIDSRFGTCWAIVGADGRFTGQFFPTGPNSRKQRQAGLEERPETAQAKALIVGEGRGLSGRAWAAILRDDKGYPDTAVDF